MTTAVAASSACCCGGGEPCLACTGTYTNPPTAYLANASGAFTSFGPGVGQFAWTGSVTKGIVKTADVWCTWKWSHPVGVPAQDGFLIKQYEYDPPVGSNYIISIYAYPTLVLLTTGTFSNTAPIFTIVFGVYQIDVFNPNIPIHADGLSGAVSAERAKPQGCALPYNFAGNYPSTPGPWKGGTIT